MENIGTAAMWSIVSMAIVSFGGHWVCQIIKKPQYAALIDAAGLGGAALTVLYIILKFLSEIKKVG